MESKIVAVKVSPLTGSSSITNTYGEYFDKPIANWERKRYNGHKNLDEKCDDVIGLCIENNTNNNQTVNLFNLKYFSTKNFGFKDGVSVYGSCVGIDYGTVLADLLVNKRRVRKICIETNNGKPTFKTEFNSKKIKFKKYSNLRPLTNSRKQIYQCRVKDFLNCNTSLLIQNIKPNTKIHIWMLCDTTKNYFKNYLNNKTDRHTEINIQRNNYFPQPKNILEGVTLENQMKNHRMINVFGHNIWYGKEIKIVDKGNDFIHVQFIKENVKTGYLLSCKSACNVTSKKFIDEFNQLVDKNKKEGFKFE